MTLRILEDAREGGDVVALHGWLSSAEVDEVERVAAGHGRPLRIDLGQLAGVDSEGLRALGRLREGGVVLTGASPYVALLLERASGEGDAAKDGSRKGGGEG